MAATLDMSLVNTIFAPQAVDPTVGSCVILYEDLNGMVPTANPDLPSGRIRWTSDDAGTVVALTETDLWLEVIPVGLGTATLTGTGYENGAIVTASLTVATTIGSDARLVVVTVTANLTMIDGGSAASAGADTGPYDAGAASGGTYTETIDGGRA